jgi:hypothetical protein
MSFTIPAISIAIPSFVLIILLFSYVAISTYIIFWVSIGSGIPFMGSGWKQNVIWYIIFFPGTIIILLTPIPKLPNSFFPLIKYQVTKQTSNVMS